MSVFHWLGFFGLIFALLYLDLKIFNKRAHEENTREALFWSFIWIFISLSFNVVIFFAYKYHWLALGLGPEASMSGDDAALKFFTGYILEKSLSVDNLFVIAMVFAYFKTPLKYQHEILFWGILGALISRGFMIVCGVALIHTFSWVTYFFGALLIFSAYKMLISERSNVDPSKNPVINFLKRFYPVTHDLHGDKFFVKIDAKWVITPLLVVLVVIETTDAMFAVDSIPAVLAVTTDPFIVFTSNVFAILGLRSLYFVLASFMDKLRYLKLSLVFVLGFVGVKMLLAHYLKLPITLSLGIIALIISIGVISSLIFVTKKKINDLSAIEVADESRKENDEKD
jgi:tellurite resistance protein TerC